MAYALPAAVIAMPTIPVFLHLPAIYGDDLGVGLAVTGAVLLIARSFDAVSDPLIGILSDRFSLHGMYRKPFILVGSLIAGPALWHLLTPSPGVDAAYLLIWSVVLYLGWTLMYVPYTAWGAELSDDYDERTRITSWREGFTLLGIVGAGVAGALAASDAASGELATGQMIAKTALIAGVIVLPILFWRVPDGTLDRRDNSQPQPDSARRSPARFLRGLAGLAANGPFVRLLFAWFINGIANGIPAALFLLYLEYGLGVGADQRPMFVLAYFLAGILAIPAWLALSRAYGKHRTWCAAMVLTCLAFAFVPLLPAGAVWSFAVICVITGTGLGADLALPPAIQADVVDYDRMKNGRRRTGLQFALWGMSAKLALAVAVGTALPTLDLFGFDPQRPGASGIMALAVIYALVPVVIKLTAIGLMWRFPLTQRRQSVICRRLAQRNA